MESKRDRERTGVVWPNLLSIPFHLNIKNTHRRADDEEESIAGWSNTESVLCTDKSWS